MNNNLVFFLIVGTEFCERFTYYGLRITFKKFMREKLDKTDQTANALMHASNAGMFLFSVLFAILSDIFFGHYKTIVSLSSVYLLGTLAVIVAGYLSSFAWFVLALVLISIGSGGIKPCISAFGASQFSDSENFFRWFYASINASSLFSMTIIPFIATKFSYALAFSIPCALFVIAYLAFLSGTKKYIIRATNPKVKYQFYKLFFGSKGREASSNKNITSSENTLAIDQSNESAKEEDEEKNFKKDLKKILRIVILYLPMTFYWACYDQQNTTWEGQGEDLNRKIFGFQFDASQVSISNPILILIFIPILSKITLSMRNKMLVGFILISLAFFAAAILEIYKKPTWSFLAQMPQFILLSASEALISISGLEISFNLAPSKFKSMVLAVWFLMIALGNILATLYETFKPFPKQWMDFIFWGTSSLLSGFLYSYLHKILLK